MDVKAIVLVGAGTHGTERHGGVPLALLDVLGRAPLYRLTERLLQSGCSGITVLGDAGTQGARWLRRALRPEVRWESASGDSIWRAAQRVFTQYSQAGAGTVLLLRLGPYAELDIAAILRFHAESGRRVTAVTDPASDLLGAFAVSAARRSDAVYLLRHQLQESRDAYARYRFEGYVNRLASASDLRQLAIDAFCGRAQIAPDGVEVRPGVWVASGARVHRRARVLAPAYIGEAARVRASVVVTRCSTLEHHTVVDCGTVLENTSVLPYTSVGAGLDVTHSVVGFCRVVHLLRQVEIEVNDTKLVGAVSSAPLRVLGQAAALAAFLPVNFLRGLFVGEAPEAALPEAVQAPAAALKLSDRAPGNTAVSDLP